MGNLIKLDLTKILKDKLFIIMAILALAASLVNPLLYKLIELIAEEQIISAKALAFLSFAPTGGSGLVICVFLPIILNKEYSNGVLRNKIIYGKSRPQIYFSLLLSSFIIAFGILLVASIISFAFSLALFKYDALGETNAAKDIGAYFLSILFEALVWAYVISLSAFFAVALHNVALAIVIPITASVMLSLLGTLLATFAKDSAAQEIISYINIYSLIEYIKIGDYTIKQILALCITPVVYAGIFIGAGFAIFNKRDIK